MVLLLTVLLILVIGSAVYCLLVIEAARRYRRRAPLTPAPVLMPISVLKPLRGLDEGLADILLS